MRKTRGGWYALLLAAGLAACGGGSGDPDDDDDGADAGDVLPGPDAGEGGDGFVPLLAGDWTMQAGDEGYTCVRKTIDQEMFIRAYRPIAPAGTHHTALSIDAGGGADGTFPCNAGTIGFQLLFGSGVGTAAYALPDGIAYKVPAGTSLLLNLHLYNAQEDAPLAGRSGVEVMLAEPGEVEHEASTMYVIDTDLTVPPGASEKTIRCTMSDDATVFGTFAHMHRMGSHMTATLQPAGGDPVVFHDREYDFESQLNYLVEPMLQVRAGDLVTGRCGFFNTTGDDLEFGDSSDDEMCVLGLYRYPPHTGASTCGQ